MTSILSYLTLINVPMQSIMSLLGGAHKRYEMITYVLGPKCCVITFIPTIYFDDDFEGDSSGSPSKNGI